MAVTGRSLQQAQKEKKRKINAYRTEKEIVKKKQKKTEILHAIARFIKLNTNSFFLVNFFL